MEELPKLYVEEQPESQKRSKVAIAFMVLILLAMPLGVYLTLRTQNPNSQAAQTENRPAENSIVLLSRNPSVNNQAVFPVDVVIRSDTNHSNLFSTRLSFPVDELEVIAVASSSADLEDQSRVYPATEWLDASYNNDQGFVNLVAGVPQSGLKTNPNQLEQQILATVFFRAKRGGITSDIQLQEGSMMLSTESGQNVLNKAQSLSITVNDAIGDLTEDTFRDQAAQFINTASSSATFKLDTPNGGEVFPYTSAVNIRWSVAEATGSASRRAQNSLRPVVSLAILMNNKFLGFIEIGAEDSGNYTWNPSATLPQAFIRPENNFKIEIERTDPVSNRKEKVISAGPFGITLNPSTSAQLLTPANLSSDRTDVNGDTVRDYKDASFILNNYFVPVTERNLKADFNNDRLINAIDLWYYTKSLNLQ